MPTVPIYIRKADYPKFLEVYSPDWLHQILSGNSVSTYTLKSVPAKDKKDTSVALSSVPDPYLEPRVNKLNIPGLTTADKLEYKKTNNWGA